MLQGKRCRAAREGGGRRLVQGIGSRCRGMLLGKEMPVELAIALSLQVQWSRLGPRGGVRGMAVRMGQNHGEKNQEGEKVC